VSNTTPTDASDLETATSPMRTFASPAGETSATGDERLPRPRIRIGAVLWGLVLLAAGTTALWITSSPARRADALDTVLGLDGLGWTVVIVVTLGATITLLALAAVIRRRQRRP
jgi:hypothetical protein